MKVTNPNADRSILACIVDQSSGKSQWHEIPPGESVDVDDYVVASTLVEHGATAAKADLAAARELWAEHNRHVNSKIASASASEGKIVQRRQATVDVATGSTSQEGEVLKGAALDAAVKAAKDAGAEVPSNLSANEKREFLAAWQARRGSSTPVDEEFLVDDDGSVVLDENDQPIPLDTVVLDEDGKATYDGEGNLVRKVVEAPDVNAGTAAQEKADGGDHSGQDEETAKGQE